MRRDPHRLEKFQREAKLLASGTVTDRDGGEKTHRFPDVLPGRRGLLFTPATAGIASYDEASIALLDLGTGEHRVLLEGGTQPSYVATGHILYGRGGSLEVVPFDLESMQVTGAPFAVADGVVTSEGWGNAHYSVSDGGTLTRLTTEWDNYVPIWMRSGRQVTFGSNRTGPVGLWRIAADGSSRPEKLKTLDTHEGYPGSWSVEDRWFAFPLRRHGASRILRSALPRCRTKVAGLGGRWRSPSLVGGRTRALLLEGKPPC